MGIGLALQTAVLQPQKIFVFVASSTWTSRPMTVSYCLDIYSTTSPEAPAFATAAACSYAPGLFICISRTDDILFLEAVPDQLHADWQSLGVDAAGNADVREDRPG